MACQASRLTKLRFHLTPEVAITRQLVAAILAQVLVFSGCSTTNAKPVTPPSAAKQRRDCSATAPCDGVRDWFLNETRDAQLTATYCDPPAPGRASDCLGLAGAVANVHRLSLKDFSALCSHLSGEPSTTAYPFVGKPDRDEAGPCGATHCRVWIWYWFSGRSWGIFTMLFQPQPASSDWLLHRCNYCDPSDCKDMPLSLE